MKNLTRDLNSIYARLIDLIENERFNSVTRLEVLDVLDDLQKKVRSFLLRSQEEEEYCNITQNNHYADIDFYEWKTECGFLYLWELPRIITPNFCPHCGKETKLKEGIK